MERWIRRAGFFLFIEQNFTIILRERSIDWEIPREIRENILTEVRSTIHLSISHEGALLPWTVHSQLFLLDTRGTEIYRNEQFRMINAEHDVFGPDKRLCGGKRTNKDTILRIFVSSYLVSRVRNFVMRTNTILIGEILNWERK